MQNLILKSQTHGKTEKAINKACCLFRQSRDVVASDKVSNLYSGFFILGICCEGRAGAQKRYHMRSGR